MHTLASRPLFTIALAFAILLPAGFSAKATTVTVAELGTDPTEIVDISDQAINNDNPIEVYAGVTQISVNGVTTNGFCIDPFHFSSSSPLTYNVVNLADAPKAPPGDPTYSGMGASAAQEISDLWAMNYTAALSNAQTAAALQIAIWEVVAGTVPSEDFTVYGNDYGASTLLADLATYTGPGANLVGLTGPGQDYVVQSVPDGGSTLALLGMTFLGLAGAGLIQNRRRVGTV